MLNYISGINEKFDLSRNYISLYFKDKLNKNQLNVCQLNTESELGHAIYTNFWMTSFTIDCYGLEMPTPFQSIQEYPRQSKNSVQSLGLNFNIINNP